VLVFNGGPAGGGFSTVGDLLRFDRALRGHRLLSAKMTDLVLTGKVQMGGPAGNTKYAYGFGDTRAGNERIHGHTGGAPGINNVLEMHWVSGWTVVVMSNYDRGSMPVAQRARQLIQQQ
jgi:CubicO group peptidase (beta-lactamase class C family)